MYPIEQVELCTYLCSVNHGMSQWRSFFATDADVEWVELYIEVATNKIGQVKNGVESASLEPLPPIVDL